jgi:hypothetical protein
MSRSPLLDLFRAPDGLVYPARAARWRATVLRSAPGRRLSFCRATGIPCRLWSVARTDAPASPPGNSASARCSRGSACRALPGYRFPTVCGLVARTDAQHRLREIQPLCGLLPGRRLTRLARATGSPPSAEPVARTDASIASGKCAEADASRRAAFSRAAGGFVSSYSQRDIPFSYTFRPDIDPAYAESMMNLKIVILSCR